MPVPNLSSASSSTAQAGNAATNIVVSGGTDNLNRAINLWRGTPENGGFPISSGVGGFSVDRPGVISAGINTAIGGFNFSLGLVGVAVIGFLLYKRGRK